MQTVIKLIQNEYLSWGCQPQGKIKISPFKFCPCLESEILNSQVIPFCELVFVKIDRGTSNCNSNSTYTMNMSHLHANNCKEQSCHSSHIYSGQNNQKLSLIVESKLSMTTTRQFVLLLTPAMLGQKNVKQV
jgi:hypothetical protein